jgi:ATP-dependent DNA helicase RecG
MTLDTPLKYVKGVGPKIEEQLLAAGLKTVFDLVYFLPRRFEDFSETVTIAAIRPGKVTVQGRFQNIRSSRMRRSLSMTQAELVDDTGKVPVIWFNQPYRAEQIEKKGDFVVSGDFGLQRQQYQIVNPSVEAAGDLHVNAGRIVPVYPSVKGMKSHILRKILLELKPFITMLPDPLPPELVKHEKLISHSDALLKLHFPESAGDAALGRERIGFEEILSLMLASAMNKHENAKLKSWQIPFSLPDAKAFVEALPFTLTDAQRKAAWEIVQNFEAGEPMNRLLQGDVGSGKTVVAGMAAYMAARGGFQSAIMAPTELLARQHAETLTRLLEPLHVNVALLTGAVKGKARAALYEHVANGSVAVVVGTHALIQEKVSFSHLGFVVIDEQHRFGVRQRQALLEKAHRMPHLLAMTATPIPRSLQLTVYGELDISLLLERPAGRLPIQTEIISPNSRAQMYTKVEAEIEAGRQVYVVCPLIFDGADAEQKSADAELRRLKSSVFKHRRMGLLHGRMTSDEKQTVMKAFSDKELDILVSTTVVEVGVDVPNATVMIIEGADRFGLAQLHQLRGRVGRSTHQSHCYLVPTTSKQPSQRLRELEKSNDGFYLAEVDLALRGPGEIYGRSQHGALNLRVANIADTKLLKRVRESAEWLLGQGSLVQYEQLLKEVERYQRLTTLN